MRYQEPETHTQFLVPPFLTNKNKQPQARVPGRLSQGSWWAGKQQAVGVGFQPPSHCPLHAASASRSPPRSLPQGAGRRPFSPDTGRGPGSSTMAIKDRDSTRLPWALPVLLPAPRWAPGLPDPPILPCLRGAKRHRGASRWLGRHRVHQRVPPGRAPWAPPSSGWKRLSLRHTWPSSALPMLPFRASNQGSGSQTKGLLSQQRTLDGAWMGQRLPKPGIGPRLCHRRACCLVP